jgi:hypothetical protein
MQAPDERKKIIERVREELSGQLKLIAVKFHDFVFRKKLVVKGGLHHDYRLVRVKLVYKHKRKTVSKNVILYPCDVLPYVRKSLDVIEEMVRAKLEDELSYKEAADIFYARYDFGLNSIKSALKMAQTAFHRLVGLGLATGLDVKGWLKRERRSFSFLSRLYRLHFLQQKMIPLSLFR